MAKRNVWVTKHENCWKVKSEGASKATSCHKTQAQAIEAGKSIARNRGCELKIQGRDGKIVNSNTYATHDPCPPKDTK